MITKLQLSNFKAFKELEINTSNLNVFAGLNGIGKSTVIQALLLLRQSFLKLGSPESQGIYLKGDLIDLGTGKDVLYSDASEEKIGIAVEFDYKSRLNCIGLYQRDENILQFANTEINWESGFSLFNNNFQYLSAQRAEPSFSYPMDSYKVDKLKSLGKYGEYTAHFIAQNKRKEINLKDILNKDAKSNHLINQIIGWLNEVSPGVTLDSTLYPELNLAKITYNFSRENGYSSDFSPVNVGFGYSYILPVLTAILAAEKDHLIIIENPESHLHPQGQAILGILLAKAAQSGIQLFIETHSDHIINGIRVAIKNNFVAKELVKVFFIDREDNESNSEILYPVIDEKGRLSNTPKGFLDEFSKQLDQLLQ